MRRRVATTRAAELARPSSPSTRQARTARGDATRARILRTARRILVRDSATGLSLRKLASEAGISLSNVQFYFASHDKLLRAVLDDELEQARAFVTQAIRARPEQPVEAAIDALLALQHKRDAARLFFSMWAVATRSAAVRRALHAFYAHWIENMAAVAAPKARERAWLFVALMEGSSLFRCGIAGPHRTDDDEVLRRGLRALLGYGGSAGL